MAYFLSYQRRNEMNLQEAQQALEQHLPCTYYSPQENGWLDADTFYNVEIIRIDTDPTHPRIITRGIQKPGLEISIVREDFHLLQLTTPMEKEFFEVEYNIDAKRGNDKGTGKITFIPADLVSQMGMGEAFKRITGFDPVYIIHWTENVTVDRYEIWSQGYTDV
jgi:hypothetical protein